MHRKSNLRPKFKKNVYRINSENTGKTELSGRRSTSKTLNAAQICKMCQFC